VAVTTVFGLLNINKPAGMTSRDVVNRVQRIVRPAKTGHAGTLDPLATGVLVVCIGPATRLIEYVQAGRKHYRGTFLLGRESDTEDITGSVRELDAPPIPSRADLEATLPRFVGQIQQRPPAYSALKIQGQRAYDLARAGKTVDLAPRMIEVYSLSLVAYSYPELVIDIECSGGTYVRSLGRDIAASLNTGAVMSSLVRTAVGPFTLADACELEALSPASLPAHLLSSALAVADLPRITVSEDDTLHIIQGKRITPTESIAGDELAAFDNADELVAILRRAADAWQPDKVFRSLTN
jgi:tRNA pseudouridine55 synthase